MIVKSHKTQGLRIEPIPLSGDAPFLTRSAYLTDYVFTVSSLIAIFRQIVCICLLLWSSAVADQAVQTIRSLQEEATKEPFRPVPVCAEGVVTWSDPSAGYLFYIQDLTGGLLVSINEGSLPRNSDRVRVTGTLERGEFSPNIANATLVNLGPDKLPNHKDATGRELLNGAYNGELVVVSGRIRSTQMLSPSVLSAVIYSEGTRITVRIGYAKKIQPDRYIGSRVRLRGVAAPVKARDSLRQLVHLQVLAASPSDLEVLHWEPANPWHVAPVSIENAFQYRPGQMFGERLKVRGKLIYREGDVAYLNDGTSGLTVRGTSVPQLELGRWYEAVGFADVENFLPVLSDSVFAASMETSTEVTASRQIFTDLMEDVQHANYVITRGKVLDRMITPGPGHGETLTLSLHSERGVFTSELKSMSRPGDFPTVETGSTVDVEGICVVSTDTEGNASGLKILIPEFSGITTVRPSDFFTVDRLLVLLSITLAILLLAAFVAYLLARRNSRLVAQMGERRAVAAERNRLARDLHDTLSQGLTGIHLQLHAIDSADDHASYDFQDRLESARTLVQQCHAEMRHSIWNLRASALEQFDLGEALKRAADSLVLGSNTTVTLRQHRNGVQIPTLVEDNLLRIGQEALTNATKHANASHLDIYLMTVPEKAILTISDDGGGNNTPEIRPGHFGLVGMKERAVRIGGALDISRNELGGFSVSIEVPLKVSKNSQHSGNASAQKPITQNPTQSPI